jgi:hypothetical protein
MPQPSATEAGHPRPRRGALARELSLLKADDRNRLNTALRTRHDNGLLVLGLAHGDTRKFRTLIHELLAVTSERGIDDVTRLLRQPPQAEPAPAVDVAAAEPAGPQRAWARLKDEFLAACDTATPRELASLTGSQARNAAARAYDWARAGRIFGVHDGHETRYPLFQLKDGRPIPQLAAILRALRARGSSDWEIALWFTTPNANLGHWEIPAQALARTPDAVARAAASQAEEVVY